MCSAAQFLGPTGIASSTCIGALHQPVGHVADRRLPCTEKHETWEFGKKAEHMGLPKQC